MKKSHASSCHVGLQCKRTNNWSRCHLWLRQQPTQLLYPQAENFTIHPQSYAIKKRREKTQLFIPWQFFRQSRPFMQRNASKWPRSCSDHRQLCDQKWIFFCGVARPCRRVWEWKNREVQGSLFCFILGLLFSLLAWSKLHDVVHRLIFMRVPSSDFQPVTRYSLLWNFGLTLWALWATFCCTIIELWWKNKDCQAPNYKIITCFDQS